MTVSPVRRSGRKRSQAVSIYDEAKQQQAQDESTPSRKKKKRVEEEEDHPEEDPSQVDNEQEEEERLTGEESNEDAEVESDAVDEEGDMEEEEEEEEESEDETSTDDDDDDDEDYGTKPSRRKTPLKSQSSPKRQQQKATKGKANKRTNAKKIPIQVRPKPKPKSQILFSPLGNNKSKGKSHSNPTSTSTKNASVKTIRTALNTLANKVLESKHDETPDNSLVAALLRMNVKKTHATGRTGGRGRGNTNTTSLSSMEDASHPSTIYTTHLHSIAQNIVAQHNVDPNGAQIALLNLMFRSIGGSIETNLPHIPDSEVDSNDGASASASGEPKLLEDMEDDDWGIVITDLVDEMRYQAPELVLFCADPHGAVHMAAVESMGAGLPPDRDDDDNEDEDMEDGERVGGGSSSSSSKPHTSMRDVPITPSSLGVREYRKIYEEFWYVLGHVAMTEGGMSGYVEDKLEDSDDEDDDDVEMEDSDDDDDVEMETQTQTTMGHESVIEQRHNKRKKRAAAASVSSKSRRNKAQDTTTTRFDTEVVRDVLCRVIELLPVGQPDVRAAATCAALSLAHAILDKTVYVGDKLTIVQRQYKAATKTSSTTTTTTTTTNKKKKNSVSAKAESLRHQMDSLQRTKTDLEEIVVEMVVKGVFASRYRDSNMFIRAMSLEALGRMTVRRPDIFIIDQYLKYFGWMLSDKAECVRIAALESLHRPFAVVEAAEAAGLGRKCPIALSSMENVTKKFLSRITDCAIDVHVSVQESAMKLMLSLLRASFLDDVDDDHMWDQVNILAFETISSPQVRRDALYFIMEQLEEFDEGDDENDRKRKSMSHQSERTVAQRLDAIASWAAHNLSNGDVPMDKIQIHLVDHLVHSLRSMPEHKCIVTNWAAMIRAITDDKAAMTSSGTSAGDRADLTKQRVLVQMLACAAKAEVESVTDPDFLHEGLDPDEAVALEREALAQVITNKAVKKSVSTGLNHEALSVALIKALPGHLDKFKSDPMILESLTCLPRYFIPSVFSLPQRKSDFLSLLKSLTEIYLLSNNEIVLKNSARSIIYLTEGDHARSNEAKAAIQKIVAELRRRIVTHLSENVEDSDETKDATNLPKSPKRKRDVVDGLSESEDEDEEPAPESKNVDNEYSLFLNLQRARVLSRLCDISKHAEDENNDGLEALCHSIADGLIRRLEKAKISQEENENGSNDASISGGWKCDDKSLSRIMAGSIDEGMQFILSIVAWNLSTAQNEQGLVVEVDMSVKESDKEGGDEAEVDDHIILRLRDRLISVVEKCFDQYLANDEITNEHMAVQQQWANLVQESACDVAVDMRTLFPKEWMNAVSPLLRALAITDDKKLIGGFVQFFRMKQLDLRSVNKKSGQADACNDLLLSFGRGVAVNWKLGNRREAGVLLSHITGHGTKGTEIVTTVSRMLKRIQPVRLLEAQMASLRQSYEDWIMNDPSDKRSDMDDKDPTDEMMARFDREEKEHIEQFETITKQASRFSMSLGVRKLSDEKTLSPALLGFIREGIRFSFSTSDELVLGSRLSFLSILIKYAQWVKKKNDYKIVVSEDLQKHEYDLKTHDDFEEVHEDDVKALFEFRTAIGLGPSPVLSVGGSTIDDATSLRSGVGSVSGSVTTYHTNASTRSRGTELTPNSTLTPYTHDHSKAHSDAEDDDDESKESSTIMMHATDTPASSKTPTHRSTRGSSMGSVRSSMPSNRSTLSPLYEEGSASFGEGGSNTDNGEMSTPGARSRRSANDSSAASPNSHSRAQSTIEMDHSVASSNSNSFSQSQSLSVASPAVHHRTQSTFDKDHSDLESPHAE